MEVLRKGIKPGDRWYEETCLNCKSRLRFQEKECKVQHDQREGSFVEVNCPECNWRVITYPTKALKVDPRVGD